MKANVSGLLFSIFLAAAAQLPMARGATGRQSLNGHVPPAVARLNLQPIGRPSAAQRLKLALGLPLRNPEALTNLLQQIYDPGSTNYHRYLSPAQFTQRFGPTESDYAAVVAFARSNGWTVISMDPGRMVVDVNAAVADIEKGCHLNLRLYQHPTESRAFLAPDTEPSLDLTIPVRDIAGLDNYVRPHPAGLGRGRRPCAFAGAGGAPGGNLRGYDFRAAYAPGVTLDGTGQTLGLLEFDGYYATDIQTYEAETGLPNVPLVNEFVDSFDGTPSDDDGEISLDIEMAISMAPGLAQVIVYQAGPDGFGNDLLKQIANDGTATEVSSSWFFSVNATTTAYLQRIAMQGQSFFEASGDGNAYISGVKYTSDAGTPADSPYVTSVGGTTLTTSGPGGAWTSETVWNNSTSGDGTNGSGGGFSTVFPIPGWQAGTSMSANHGSATQRNLPDVAMAADDVWVIFGNGQSNWYWGTSCAAPLWAGFTALINQQAAHYSNGPVGFINPALYALGNGPQASAVFHDITTGNNTNLGSPDLFYAAPGYDLCTGWGSPTGINLINALTLSDPLIVSPAGFSASGAGGGPFYPPGQTFYLTNSGPANLSWSATDSSSWLAVSPASGLLAPGGKTNVTITLAASANSLTAGFYSYNLVFSNLTMAAEQVRPCTLQVGLPLLTFDDLYDPNWNQMPTGYGGVSWSNFYFLNAMTYGSSGYQAAMVSSPNVIFNGNSQPASIRSPAPFDLLSAVLAGVWDDNLIVEARGYIGNVLAYDVTNTLSATVATPVHFNYFGVTAVSFLTSGGTKHTAYNGAGRYFAMDNVILVTHSASAVAPALQKAAYAAGAITFGWNAPMGQTYQVQYNTNLVSPTWANSGFPLTATNSILTISDTNASQQRYYRLLLLP